MTPEKPRKWRRRFKVFAVGLLALVCATALVAWGLKLHFGKAGGRELAAVAAKLDADDPGWRLEPLVKRYNESAPPPERNSASVVLKVFDALPEDWRRLDGNRVPDEKERNRRPGPKRADAMAALRDPTAAARTLARTLKDVPDGRYPYEFHADPFKMTWPHTDKLLAVSHLLRHEAALNLTAGDPDAAVGAIHAGLNAARSVGETPIWMAQMVAGASAMMAHGTLGLVLGCAEPKSGLAELQAAFVTEADVPRMRYVWLGERAFGDAMYSAFESGKKTPAELAEMWQYGWGGRQLLEQYQTMSRGDHAELIRVQTDKIAATRLPWHEQLAALDAVRPPTSDLGHPLGAHWSRTSANNRQVADRLRVRADLLAASAAIACERFRQKAGRWPAALDDIPKDILPTVPADPFDNAPLRLRVFPDGLGVVVGRHKAESTQVADQTDRVAFRLWNPDHRNLPPPDPKGKP